MAHEPENIVLCGIHVGFNSFLEDSEDEDDAKVRTVEDLARHFGFDPSGFTFQVERLGGERIAVPAGHKVTAGDKVTATPAAKAGRN